MADKPQKRKKVNKGKAGNSESDNSRQKQDRSAWLYFGVIALVACALYFLGIFSLSPQKTQVLNSDADVNLEETPSAPKPTAPTQHRAQAPAPTPPRETPQPQAPPEPTVVRQSPSAPTKPGARRPLPPNAVPYRMEGRLMVAYGDILLGRPAGDSVPNSGFAQAPKVQYWDTAEIPYAISPKITFPERIHKVIEYFNENTPVRFVPFTGQADAISFEPGDEHCRSYLGRIGGHQPLYLSKDCYGPQITHELMHALGFVHEQSRPDRDQYIRINWDRIEEDKKDQFDIVPAELAQALLNRPFDYRSVMLYLPNSFAKVPNQITIESLTNEQIDPTQEGLSREDLNRVHAIYNSRR